MSATRFVHVRRALRALRCAGAVVATCALLSSVGCGATTTRASEAETRHARRAAAARQPELERAGGAATLAVPRATDGAVTLALFVDAGSRDATPPQLATAVAWLAAARTEGVRVRVEPDGTEWSVSCTPARLLECAAQLAGVLATREVDEAELLRVRGAIVDARRRALTDDVRTADGLALRGVIGEAGGGAFGRVEDDARLSAANVARFADAHYGPSRALFVAAGDVDGATLRAAVAAALASAPAASAARGERAASPAGARADTGPSAQAAEPVRVTVSESDAVGVALRVGSVRRAGAIAARMNAQRYAEVGVGVRDGAHAGGVRGTAIGFGVRGHGVVLARRAGDARSFGGVSAWVAQLVAALEIARRETDDAADAPTPPDALDVLARSYGRAFMIGDMQTTDASADSAIAVGVVVRGGRAPSVRVPDPDAALARETTTAAMRARAAALASADAPVRGSVTARSASVALTNGARIEVRGLPGATVRALAVRFSADAAGEPTGVLGRAALAAEALVAACVDGARHDDTSLQPVVDARSFGFVATAHEEAALLRALHCALEVSPDDAAIEDARHVLVASLDVRVDPVAHAQSLAARALAPETPAVIAPRGEPDRVGSVPIGEVRAMLVGARRGARIAVALAGDVDVSASSARLGRRLAALDAGALGAPQRVAAAAIDDVVAATWRGPGVRVVVTLRAEPAELRGADVAGTATGIDARAAALALGEQLSAAPGARFVAAGGELGAAGAFAWIALDVDEDALAALPSAVRRATALLGAGAVGDAAVRSVRARLAERHAEALAAPALVASALAAARIDGGSTVLAPASDAALGRVVDALMSARVRYVIARPAGSAGGR